MRLSRSLVEIELTLSGLGDEKVNIELRKKLVFHRIRVMVINMF